MTGLGWVFGGLLAAAVVGAIRLRMRRYRALFAVDPATSQAVAFDASGRHATACEVWLAGDGFDWPANVASGSVVLEVSIATNLLGAVLDPWLELHTAAGPRRSYLERGAHGVRLVHFGSGIRFVPGSRVRLGSRGLRWRHGSARLWSAPPLDATRGVTLVLAPHSDDAELAAFGLFGANTWIVTVTAGEVGTFPLPGHVPGSADEGWARAVRRAADSRDAAAAGGVPPEQVVWLGYFDGTLPQLRRDPKTAHGSSVMPQRTLAETRRLHRNPIEFAEPTGDWQGLVADLRQVLCGVQPARVVLPHPDLDLHSDHVATSLALLEAAEELAGRVPEFDLLYYANHRYGARDGRNPQPVGPVDGTTPLGWSPVDGAPLYDFPASVAMSQTMQAQKRSALRAMVDLLPAPRRRPWWIAGPRRLLGRCLHGLFTYDLSYLRRNVRVDELFFVVLAANGPAHRRAMLERFSTWPQRGA